MARCIKIFDFIAYVMQTSPSSDGGIQFPSRPNWADELKPRRCPGKSKKLNPRCLEMVLYYFAFDGIS